MKVNLVEIDMEAFGAEFAGMDSKDQGLFFRGLARELMHWKSDHLMQMQFFYVADELRKEEKEKLEAALGCLWYQEEV